MLRPPRASRGRKATPAKKAPKGAKAAKKTREQTPSAAELVDDAGPSIPVSRFWLTRNRNGSVRDPSAGPMMRLDESTARREGAAKSGGLGDHEIIEVGVLCRGFIRPEQEQRAAFLGAVRTMRLAGPDVK